MASTQPITLEIFILEGTLTFTTATIISPVSANGNTTVDNTVENMTVENVYTYTGDGMSIGSGTMGGINNLLYDHIFMGGAGTTAATTASPAAPTPQTGIHVKSDDVDGGSVNDVYYYDICIRDQQQSINVDANISKTSGSTYPSFTNLR